MAARDVCFRRLLVGCVRSNNCCLCAQFTCGLVWVQRVVWRRKRVGLRVWPANSRPNQTGPRRILDGRCYRSLCVGGGGFARIICFCGRTGWFCHRDDWIGWHAGFGCRRLRGVADCIRRWFQNCWFEPKCTKVTRSKLCAFVAWLRCRDDRRPYDHWPRRRNCQNAALRWRGLGGSRGNRSFKFGRQPDRRAPD